MRKFLKKSKDISLLVRNMKERIFIWRRKSQIKKYLKQIAINAKLHLGCGDNLISGWLNADLFSSEEVVFIDIRKKLPLPDNSMGFILAEHTIEHISYKDARKMLKESYRVLNPGGIIRIATPDLDKYVNLYRDELNEFQTSVVNSVLNNWIRSGFYNASNYIPDENDNDRAFFINDIFMNYEHKFIYNHSSLSKLMQDSGFSEITICTPGASQYPELNGIETHTDPINAYLTLTIQGTK